VTAAKKKSAPKVAKVETVVAYKGFDADLKCRGFQYAAGKTYHHEGSVVRCTLQGFHSCEMPLDVLRYYAPNTSRFAVVDAGGSIDRAEDGDSKIASATITIKTELRLPELIRRGIEWILAAAKSNTATIAHTHAAATGYCGHAAATGDSGHAAATGYCGHAAATGDRGHAAATGDRGHAAATGDSGHAAATGYCGHAAATGDRGHAAATGTSGHAAATGDSGHAAATGYCGHAAATGDRGHAAATGTYGHAAATGYCGHAAATGDRGHAAATGVCGTAFAGFGGKAKAGATGAFAIAWLDEKAKRARLIVGTPGENGIKADVLYCVSASGVLEEVL
jgi:hypothetical protein